MADVDREIRSYDGAGTLRAAIPATDLELTELVEMQLPSSARVAGSNYPGVDTYPAVVRIR